MTKHGAHAWVARVVAGDRSGAGAMDVYGAYPSFSAGAKSFLAFSADPDMIALRNKAQTAQVADMKGPWVGRLIFGSPASAPRREAGKLHRLRAKVSIARSLFSMLLLFI
mgnify:CR=1 FL=1